MHLILASRRIYMGSNDTTTKELQMDDPLVAMYDAAIRAELEKPVTDYDRINLLFYMLDLRLAEFGICELAA